MEDFDSIDSFFSDDSATDNQDSGQSQAADSGSTSQQSYDPQYVQNLEQRLSASEKWQQDAARFFGGQSQQVSFTPEQQAVQQWEQNLIQQAVQASSMQMVWDSAINAAQAANPHLVPFQNAIQDEGNLNEAVAAFQQKNGRMPQPGKETIDACISNFTQKLQAYQTATAQQQTAAQMQQNALTLTTGDGQPTAQGKLTAEQIGGLSSDDFAKLRHQMHQGAYKI
jgi:hypothetical protein